MSTSYPSSIIQQVERGWNQRFICISVEIDLGLDTRDVLFNDAELTQPAISAAHIVQSEDLLQRLDQRWSNQSRPEIVVHTMPEKSLDVKGRCGSIFSGFGKAAGSIAAEDVAMRTG